MLVGQLVDAFGPGQLGGHGLGPLVGVLEEAFVVDGDGDAVEGGGGHGRSSGVSVRSVCR